MSGRGLVTVEDLVPRPNLPYRVRLGHREHTQDAAHRDFPVIAMQVRAESADVLARLFTTRQQLPRGQRGLRGTVFVFDPVTAALLAQVLAQQVPR